MIEGEFGGLMGLTAALTLIVVAVENVGSDFGGDADTGGFGHVFFTTDKHRCRRSLRTAHTQMNTDGLWVF